MRSKLLIAGMAVCLVASTVSQASATMITLQASFEYSGGTAPEGLSPWLTVTVDDGGGIGAVTLTLEARNLTDMEFVSEWLLNVAPPLDPTALVFSDPVKVGSFTDPTISLGENAFKADGDGYFDIKLTFDTLDGLPTRFSTGDSVSYTVTAPSLTANSFNCFSAPNGAGAGLFPMAAHVQAIGPGDNMSGWVSTPEPACFAFLALGGLAVMRRQGVR
jgi:hypothetical protein